MSPTPPPYLLREPLTFNPTLRFSLYPDSYTQDCGCRTYFSLDEMLGFVRGVSESLENVEIDTSAEAGCCWEPRERPNCRTARSGARSVPKGGMSFNGIALAASAVRLFGSC